MNAMKTIIQGEHLNGAGPGGSPIEYIVWEWLELKQRWETVKHPRNDWTTKRRAEALEKRLHNLTAWDLAGDWWWDEHYTISTRNGRVQWESASVTNGGTGKRIRLMRTNIEKECACVAFVLPGTPMRLTRK